MDDLRWLVPGRQMELPEGEVHVWRAGLDLPEFVLEQLGSYLSVDEQRRADRFRFDHHRRWSIASRGILRTILSHYRDLAPGQFQFEYGPQGKPGLMPAPQCAPLEFNLSHSENLAVYAIAPTNPVGIDVEGRRAVSTVEQLIQRYFSQREQSAILTMPAESITDAFLQYWTCKEATLKAMGQGLMGLKTIEIVLTPEDIQILPLPLPSPSLDPFPQPWQLQLFQPEPNFMAAVAVRARSQQFKFWHWQPTQQRQHWQPTHQLI